MDEALETSDETKIERSFERFTETILRTWTDPNWSTMINKPEATAWFQRRILFRPVAEIVGSTMRVKLNQLSAPRKKKKENKEKGKKEKLDVVVARDWRVEWVERCRGCYGSQVAGTNTSTKVLLHTGTRSVWLALYLYTESDNCREPTSGRHIL